MDLETLVFFQPLCIIREHQHVRWNQKCAQNLNRQICREGAVCENMRACSWEDNIEMNVKERGGADWIRDRVH